MSVTEVTEKDMEEREKAYERAVMKSNKEEKQKNRTKTVKKKATTEVEEEEDDEEDAFTTYNPFGGSSYK